MRTFSRSLRVESCEDRVVPSTMTFMSTGHSQGLYGSVYTQHDRDESATRVFAPAHSAAQGYDYFAPQTELFVVTSAYNSPIFIRVITWGGNWNTGAGVSATPTARSASPAPDVSSSSSDSVTRARAIVRPLPIATPQRIA